jgi:GNAT superfamily N-acetyltransferase
VAATCHFDLEDWLQPDWVLEPATMTFRWRAVQRRPGIECTLKRAPFDSWQQFARFHYLTATLHRAAKCWVLYVEGQPAAFAAAMYRPHPKARDIFGLSRGVVLPDYQGLGLIFALIDRIGAAYAAHGLRCHSYPAHPGYIRSHDKSPHWKMMKAPGLSSVNSATSDLGSIGGRPCAVFEYCGPPMPMADAEKLVST